jgi:uncharacterized protein involved in exopolysaccharide biosynthesis
MLLCRLRGEKGVNALEELQPLLNPMQNNSTAINSQIEILKSRMILGRVVDKLKLDIVVAPNYLPLIGKGHGTPLLWAESGQPALWFK